VTDEPELDLESRQLCPDGSCVGVLGDDGRCKVCGAVGDGSVVPIASRAPVGDGDDEVSSDDAADGEEDDRKLCPDGACIGLIGSDGRCKVCGLAAS
jgi:hypothetical protein